MNKRIHCKLSVFHLISIVLAIVVTLFVLVPIINIFVHIDRISIEQVLDKDSLWTIVLRSICVSLITTIISMTLAYFFTLCIERTAIPGKHLLRILAVLPMLIPSVSIGMGIILLFGNNGVISNLLSFPLGSMYGAKGIILGSVLYSFPVAFLMIDNILKYEDSSPYEAAVILGLSRWDQFKVITFPYLKKTMIVVAFSIFTLSFTDYGVPLMVGGKYKTLPVVMYQEVIGQLNFGKGGVYGSILLIPAIVSFVMDFFSKKHNNTLYIVKPFTPIRNLKRDACAMIFAIIVSLFNLLPIIAFLILAFVNKYPSDMRFTFQNLLKTLQIGGGKYIVNSLLIAIMVSVIGVTLAIVIAYLSARTNSGIGRYLHLISMSMAAIPGVVLGLAFVLTFKTSFIYGTIGILVIVNIVHFFASPYLMIYTVFTQINENLETVARTLAISRSRFFFHILIPQCKKTIEEMFASFFVNSMMTISAVSFLANSRTKPIALMINQFEAQAQMEYAAVVSLMILIINLLVKIFLEWKSVY